MRRTFSHRSREASILQKTTSTVCDRWGQMAGVTETFLLLLLLFLPSLGPSSDPQHWVPQPELPPLMRKALDEFLSRKYLHALADAYIFASTRQPWSPLEALRYLSRVNSSLSMEGIRSILKDYQSLLAEDPQFLVSEMSALDILQFTTVLRLLLSGRKEQGFCVDLMGTLLSLSDGEFVEEDFISDLPMDLSDETFRNLAAVFKDSYDIFSVTTQKAIYKWITHRLKRASKSIYNPDVWMTAENLWFLGRYMVHLTVWSIHRVRLSEMRTFIHYDNATKQLDSVYDIKSSTGKAFLHRINASGFDMSNVSTAYRLGLLVCFYDRVQLLGASDARCLLHQLMKCSQLRGSLAGVQKLKSQLLSLLIQNQTLNESLGSMSDAVVGLTLSQLESLSAPAVQRSIGVLQRVEGWTRSQTVTLVHKYMGTSKVLYLSNMSELGSLVSGLDTNLFYSVNRAELAQAAESFLLRHVTRLSPAQRHALITQMLTSGDTEHVLRRVQGPLFAEVPLSVLLKNPGLESAALVDKHLTSSQAIFLYDYLSKKTPEVDLISNGQLLRGITCDRIYRMDKDLLTENLSVLKRNFHLLSPLQMNCFAWRFWDVLETPYSTIPAVLLVALPAEYVTNMPESSCKNLLFGLSNVDLDRLTVHLQKHSAVMEKVLQCLPEGIRDEYDVDLLGLLLCHLAPEAIRAHLSPAAVPAALQQLRSCGRLTAGQRASIRDKLLHVYGLPARWSAELTQDMGALVTLLSREEILVLANKYPEEVLPLVAQAGRSPLPEDFLAAIFEVVRGDAQRNWSNPVSETDCHLIRAPSADDIRKLSEANVFWSAGELQCMSDVTFSETVELLGAVRGYSLTQLAALKSRAEQAWGPLSAWRSYHVIALGSIALALTKADIKELNLSSVDTMSMLSQQSSWSPQQMTHLLYGFLGASGLSIGELRGSDLAGLGVLFCGVEPSQVLLISPEAYSSAARSIGSLPCTLPVLRGLKRISEQIFGAVSAWSGSVLQEVGAVAAGMSVEEMRNLHPAVMPYLQPQAIAAIPCEVFGGLAWNQEPSEGMMC
ncbi:hypothetical protein GJAV_G00266820 [Gymnothorax javanicus]|nr:hypothetical protein GJAV_G00266820 [Gymnothorax javanicus]